MKIIFDIDGTLTDYNKFIKQYAIPYFCEKLHMKVQHPCELEITDIFEMSLLPIGEQERLLNGFWISHRFFLFSLLGRFRRGTRVFFRKLKQQGCLVEIYTSRVKAYETTATGLIFRLCTRIQFLLNGVIIGKKQLYFWEDDNAKIQALLQEKPDLVFDDKPSIIKQLQKSGIPVVCVRGLHNTEIVEAHNTFILEDDFYNMSEELIEKMLSYNIFFDSIKQ